MTFWATLRPEEEKRERARVHAFLARYMRLSLHEISRLTRSEIIRYCDVLGEMFRREGGSATFENSGTY